MKTSEKIAKQIVSKLPRHARIVEVKGVLEEELANEIEKTLKPTNPLVSIVEKGIEWLLFGTFCFCLGWFVTMFSLVM
jgi:hypothetical protein